MLFTKLNKRGILPFVVVACAGATLLANQSNVPVEQRGSNENQRSYDYEEVVYEHIKQHRSFQGNYRSTNVAANWPKYYNHNEDLLAPQKAEDSKAAEESKEEPKQPYFLSGYCFLEQSVEVSSLSSYAYLRCNFDKKNATLAVSLVPDVFSRALIGKPLYVVQGEERHVVAGGVIMNQEQTSLNLASVVNDRKIEQMTAMGMVAASTIVTEEAKGYLEELKSSRTTEEVNYVTTGTGDNQTATPVVTSNTEKPYAGDYIASATIQLVSELVKIIGENAIKELPYIFKTAPNTMYFVDLMMYPDGGLPRINIDGNSLSRVVDASQSQTVVPITVDAPSQPQPPVTHSAQPAPIQQRQ